jgi:TadE-like protein
MNMLRRFTQDTSGGPAAEFALVLPLALIFLFGIIDVGRYMWEVNRAEKATQTGARWAVATDIIASDLVEYSFVDVDGGVLQGDPILLDTFPGVDCDSTGCSCANGGTCDFDASSTNGGAFNTLVDRMNDIKVDIGSTNVVVNYRYSGLGYAGDPNGPDVAPIVTVQVRDLTFTPMIGAILGINFNIPNLSYSLTMEDGTGGFSN